jgi:hypothetical protein
MRRAVNTPKLILKDTLCAEVWGATISHRTKDSCSQAAMSSVRRILPLLVSRM